MTTYRLPDQLGGGIAEGVANFGTVGRRLVKVPGINGDVELPSNCLTEVKPPLPPEPPVGAVVQDKDGDVWVRTKGGARPWACHTGDIGEWDMLNEVYGPLIRLVPDPADDAPDLPYRRDGDLIEVKHNHAGDSVPVWVEIKPSWMSPEEVEERAAALLSAARAAREVEQP